MKKKKKIGRPKRISTETMTEVLFQVFARKGFAETSIADLTKATGSRPPSLYLAYGSKEGMYLAALEYYRKTWLITLEKTLSAADTNFEQRIRSFLLTACALFSCEGKPAGCMMTFSALAFQMDESDVAVHLQNERLVFTRWLEEEAQQALDAGELQETLTAEEFACFITTLEKGLALAALDTPKQRIVTSMIERVLSLLFLPGSGVMVSRT